MTSESKGIRGPVLDAVDALLVEAGALAQDWLEDRCGQTVDVDMAYRIMRFLQGSDRPPGQLQGGEIYDAYRELDRLLRRLDSDAARQDDDGYEPPGGYDPDYDDDGDELPGEYEPDDDDDGYGLPGEYEPLEHDPDDNLPF